MKLVRQDFPSAQPDVDTRLLDKPFVVLLPFFVQIGKFYMKCAQELREELVLFHNGDL